MLHIINRINIVKVQDKISVFKFSISRYLPSMMLDDTRGGLDASSLHWDTSMINYKAKKFRLLSCHL